MIFDPNPGTSFGIRLIKRFKTGLAGGLKAGLACALPGLCLMALAVGPASAQQKYILMEKDAAGDVRQNSESFTMTMTTKTAATNASSTFKMAETEQQQYRTQVLAVDGAGHPTDIRRTYSVYVKRQDGMQGKQVQTDSLQGKSARVRRVGGKVVVEGANGPLSEESRQELMTLLDEDTKYFPNHAVAIGEEWSPDSASIAKSFKGAQNLNLRGRIVDVVPFHGHRCAHVKWKLSADMPADQFTMKMTMQGDSYEALDIHHTLSMVLEGPMVMRGAAKAGGATANMQGTGMVGMKMTAEWTKIGGKPAAAKG